MAAQTFTLGSSANTTAIGGNPGAGARVVHSLYETITLPEVPEVGDIYKIGWLPKGAVPIGGYYAATDIDTGTETFDMDIGIAANGVDSADPDFFVNSGVQSGDAITDFALTNAANIRMITGKFPVVQLGANTLVQGQVIAVAHGGGTGTFTVRIDYLMPGVSTS